MRIFRVVGPFCCLEVNQSSIVLAEIILFVCVSRSNHFQSKYFHKMNYSNYVWSLFHCCDESMKLYANLESSQNSIPPPICEIYRIHIHIFTKYLKSIRITWPKVRDSCSCSQQMARIPTIRFWFVQRTKRTPLCSSDTTQLPTIYEMRRTNNRSVDNRMLNAHATNCKLQTAIQHLHHSTPHKYARRICVWVSVRCVCVPERWVIKCNRRTKNQTTSELVVWWCCCCIDEIVCAFTLMFHNKVHTFQSSLG